ncbi:MAG TPA: hypothetical protein VF816_04615 [Rhodocyclaceae bacterium]
MKAALRTTAASVEDRRPERANRLCRAGRLIQQFVAAQATGLAAAGLADGGDVEGAAQLAAQAYRRS